MRVRKETHMFYLTAMSTVKFIQRRRSVNEARVRSIDVMLLTVENRSAL